MRRRRTQQIVVGIIVGGFVLATVGLVGSNPGDDSANPASTPTPRDIDPTACDAAVDGIISRLGASFDGTDATGPVPPNESVVPPVGEAEWRVFFQDVARHCADSGGAVSEVIVFSADRARSTDDPVAALRPAVTAEQLCQLEIRLSPEAATACATTADLADLPLDELLLDDTRPAD